MNSNISKSILLCLSVLISFMILTSCKDKAPEVAPTASQDLQEVTRPPELTWQPQFETFSEVPTPSAAPATPAPSPTILPAPTLEPSLVPKETPASSTQEQSSIAFTVKSVKFDNKGTARDSLPGHTYLLIDMNVQNNSTRTVTLSSLLCYSLIRDKNAADPIEPTLNASPVGNLDGSLKSGEAFSGEIAFEVPMENSQFVLNVRTDLLSANALVFDLTPFIGAPSQSLSAEPAEPEIWDVGETADLGYLKFTVNSVRKTDASMTASDQKKSELLLISLTVQNPMDTQVSIDPENVFALIDASYTEFKPSTNVSSTPFPGGAILPGQSISGELTFIVPSSAYMLRIIPDATQDATLYFSIS